MIEHHIQKEILHRLVLHDTARFAELRPPGIDGNLFTYHLQQLIKQKYIVKNDDGTYELTPAGKAVGITIKLSGKALLEQAHAVVLLAVRDQDGAWLLRRRAAQPNYGQIGFIHGEPIATESVTDTARAVLERRTGLTADFTVAGSGYVHTSRDGSLEHFVAFTLLAAQIEHAEPTGKDETGENIWIHEPDFTASDMLPSMPDLVRELTTGQLPFFADLHYDF